MSCLRKLIVTCGLKGLYRLLLILFQTSSLDSFQVPGERGLASATKLDFSSVLFLLLFRCSHHFVFLQAGDLIWRDEGCPKRWRSWQGYHKRIFISKSLFLQLSVAQADFATTMPVPDFLLSESAAGYSLFKVTESEEIGVRSKEFLETLLDLYAFSRLVKLVAFGPFKSAANALENINDISEGRVANIEFLNFHLQRD